MPFYRCSGGGAKKNELKATMHVTLAFNSGNTAVLLTIQDFKTGTTNTYSCGGAAHNIVTVNDVTFYWRASWPYVELRFSGMLYYATPANYKKTTSVWNSGVGVSPNVGNDFYCAVSGLNLV